MSCKCNNEEKIYTPAEECDHIVNWIKEYFVTNGPNSKAVIGISGGKDSTICAALCVKALGADNVIGVLMPNGEQRDKDDAKWVCNILGIEHTEINIGATCESLYRSIDKGLNINFSKDNSMVSTNLPSRVRMTTLYAVAALVGGRVCCTSNRSERFVGYFTKWGDNAGDFAPIADYTVTELLAIGEVLHQQMNIPNELIFKKPSDGMCGKTDEDNLGFSYNILDDYIINKKMPEYGIFKKIINKHKMATHKVTAMPFCCKKIK